MMCSLGSFSRNVVSCDVVVFYARADKRPKSSSILSRRVVRLVGDGHGVTVGWQSETTSL